MFRRLFFTTLSVISVLIVFFLTNDSSTSATRFGSYAQAQEDDEGNVQVDVASSAKRSRTGKQAFDKKDYLLAKKECEEALRLNPDNANAQEVLEKTRDAQKILNESIREVVSLFKAKQNDEAFEKLRVVKDSCVNYPAADALLKKGVKILVDEGWDAYGGDKVDEAAAKAEEALELIPDDSTALELLKECGKKPTPSSDSSSTSESFLEKKAGARAVLKYNGADFAFRYCPPSRYTKASSWNKSGRYAPKGFWIGETETTQKQWNAVGAEKIYECRSKGEQFPVETVTWSESVAFIRILNGLGMAPKGWHFELPTEQQWEYACFAGTTGQDCVDFLDEYAWYKSNSGGKTHKVGTKKPNQWGLYDMLGNVSEWTNSQSAGSDAMVNRGGSYLDDTSRCNPINRSIASKFTYTPALGFRLVLVRNQSK